jgi:hypothetical protein
MFLYILLIHFDKKLFSDRSKIKIKNVLEPSRDVYGVDHIKYLHGLHSLLKAKHNL